MTRDLEALRDWLQELGVTHVGMESTGVYWRPVYAGSTADFLAMAETKPRLTCVELPVPNPRTFLAGLLDLRDRACARRLADVHPQRWRGRPLQHERLTWTRPDARQLFEDRTRRISKACALLPHPEALPQHEGEKSDEDMRLAAILALMPSCSSPSASRGGPRGPFRSAAMSQETPLSLKEP